MKNALDNKRIVVVEDSPSLADIYRKYLSSEGATVYNACDGEEGYSECVLKRPDLILSDISMPKLSGLEMLSKLQANEVTKNIPVIMLTSCSMKMHVMEAYKLGAKDYLVKPASFKLMLQKIKKVLDL